MSFWHSLKAKKQIIFNLIIFFTVHTFLCTCALFPLEGRLGSWLNHDVNGCWHSARNCIGYGKDGSGCSKIVNIFSLAGGREGKVSVVGGCVLIWVGIKSDWNLFRRLEFTKKSICNLSDKVLNHFNLLSRNRKIRRCVIKHLACSAWGALK